MKKAWLIGPCAWFVCVLLILITWAVMEPSALHNFFDQGGYSPFELATLPVFGAIVPLVWICCPFEGSRKRKAILCLLVSIVAVMAIVKEMDLHNTILHSLYPSIVGEDGSIIPGQFFKPDGRPLSGTAFKMRFLTNAAIPLGAKAVVLGYFMLFFGTFAATFLYLLPTWVKGVFSLNPAAWAFGCAGASGVMVQITDRIPAWIRHGAEINLKADGVISKASSFCTAFEEGGEMMLALFCLLTIVLAWKATRNTERMING